MASYFHVLRKRLAALRCRIPSTEKMIEILGRWLAQKTFSTADRLTLYEDLAFLLDNNLKVEKALTVMINSCDNKRLPVLFCLEDILNAIRLGKSVDQGLLTWIPLQEVAILSAGVEDGNLAAALYRAISVVQSMADMKSALISALSYPVLLIASTFAMMKMVTVFFLPRLESLANRDAWTGALYWLSTLSEFFVNYALILAVLMILLVAFVVWSLPNLTGKTRQHVLDRLLPWSVYRDILGVSFLLNFSALMRAQIKTENALEMLSRYATPWLYERLTATRHQVKQGDHMGLALRNAGYGFPSLQAINKLVLLTDGDNAEPIIENFAHMWLKKTLARIKRTASVLSAFALSTSAGYMLLIVMSTQDLNNLAGTR